MDLDFLTDACLTDTLQTLSTNYLEKKHKHHMDLPPTTSITTPTKFAARRSSLPEEKDSMRSSVQGRLDELRREMQQSKAQAQEDRAQAQEDRAQVQEAMARMAQAQDAMARMAQAQEDTARMAQAQEDTALAQKAKMDKISGSLEKIRRDMEERQKNCKEALDETRQEMQRDWQAVKQRIRDDVRKSGLELRERGQKARESLTALESRMGDLEDSLDTLSAGVAESAEQQMALRAKLHQLDGRG
jgi:chromosome segregation ATPase